VLSSNNTKNKIDQVHFHYRNLIKSNAIIILSTKENNKWLNSQLSDIIKSPGFGKKNKFIFKSVLFFTKSVPNIFLNINDLDLIKSTSEELSSSIKSFIEKLK